MKFENLNNAAVKDNEQSLTAFWNEIDLLKKSVEAREDSPSFVFYEGPPTANGKPGIHHVLARTLKDSVCRYKTMSGYQVKRKAGWDTHGLPVEIEVEKKLSLGSKQEIEEYGIKEFNEACRESVFEYESLWRQMTERMGYLIDMDNPYITLDNNYIESVWWILDKFHKEGYIYEGHKILPYCSRCGTGLASHEVAQGYKEVKTNTLIAKFKRKDAENEYFQADRAYANAEFNLVIAKASYLAAGGNLLQYFNIFDGGLPTPQQISLEINRDAVLPEVSNKP